MKNRLETLQISTGSGLHRIEVLAIICGPDLSVCFAGGDTFHIGASALAIPRPSLANSEITSASASVLCVTGHKEDEIARQAALDLASKFKTRVNVTCGLHIDDATGQDIKLLTENYLLALAELGQKLGKYFSEN